MPLFPVVAQSLFALTRQYGPVEPVGSIPLHIVVRTKDPSTLWLGTSIPWPNALDILRAAGVYTALLPYIEQLAVQRAGFAYVRLGPPAGKAAITDGLSNTIMIGEVVPSAPLGVHNSRQSVSIVDGTSNTILFSEQAGSTTGFGRGSASITDGTSNTIMFGEALPPAGGKPKTSITDGTSNTIMFGEAAPPTRGKPKTSITDGTSNTIMFGEASPPAGGNRQTSIIDGTSNTILYAEVL